VVIIALGALFYWYSTRSKDNDALRWEQWNDLTQAMNFDVSNEEAVKLNKEYPGKPQDWQFRLYKLNKFEEEHPGTPQARLARFQRARLLMEDTQVIGALLLEEQRNTTLKAIAQARDLYEQLIAESSDRPDLAQEAIYNAAKANEILGEFDRAKELYQRLLKEFPSGMDAASAEKALKRIESYTQEQKDQLKQLASQKKTP
jgi:tetratricopeptide (TPR) repeat protein